MHIKEYRSLISVSDLQQNVQLFFAAFLLNGSEKQLTLSVKSQGSLWHSDFPHN
jgi:hypothetical protein